MKNKIILTLIFLVFFFKLNSLEANEEFIFDITEIEVTDEGNFFKGLKRGTAVTNSGQTTIVADIFEYDRITKILNAKGNVEIVDKTNDFLLKSNFITYYKNEEKIFSQGITEATIQSTYEVQSKDITLYRKSNLLKSNEKTFIFDDKFTKYETDILNYEINENIFKGSNIKVFTNINKKNMKKSFTILKMAFLILKIKILLLATQKSM